MKIIQFLLLISLLSFSACTKSSSDDNGGGGDPGSGSFVTDCGVVFNGTLQNPINADQGIVGTVRILSSNVVIFSNGEQEILVKLHGLGITGGAAEQSAIDFLRNLAAGQITFFRSDGDCSVTVSGGGVAIVGQLFTATGASFVEELVRAGLGRPEVADACGGALIAACLRALDEASGSDAIISNFLWKPVSERDGNLVVLLNPAGATVVVNGVTLVDFGPSNGRGTTARANQSGASFGSNIVVQVFDNLGRVIRFPGGADRVIIPNGANRVEVP